MPGLPEFLGGTAAGVVHALFGQFLDFFKVKCQLSNRFPITTFATEVE
jgi:hypothetical protein